MPKHAKRILADALISVIRSKKGEKIEMIRRMMCLVVVGLILSIGEVHADTSEKEKAAASSAEKWLGIIDEGKDGQSWKETAESFRIAVKQEQWEQSLQVVRRPLGKLISRKIKTKTYRTSLPGAPDGEYVVIQFESSFEKKKSAVETVTSMLERDGKWRVSGYYLK